MNNLPLNHIDKMVSFIEGLTSFGAAKGSFYEILFAKIMEGECLSTEKNSQEGDILIDGIVYSLKSYQYYDKKASPTQITTNFIIRDYLEQHVGKQETDNRDIIASSVGIIRNMPVLIFSIDKLNKLYWFSQFDYDQLLANTYKIAFKQNRKHSDYKFIDKESNILATVKYGKREDNAFQRGVWVSYTPKSSLFISLIKGRKYCSNNQSDDQLYNLILGKE